MAQNYIICRENEAIDENASNKKIFILNADDKLINKLKYSPIHNKNLLTDLDKKSMIKMINEHTINNEHYIDSIDNIKQILIIPELEKDELLFYISDGKLDENNFDVFLKILKINLYYQNSLNTYNIKKRLSHILLNIDTFWEQYNVSKINLTNSFRLNEFNICHIPTNDDKTINDEINKNEVNKNEIDYLNDIENYKENIIQSNIYYKMEFENIDKDYILEIYNMLTTEYMKYSFLVNLLCSKKHCHLVLKNKQLLINSKPIFDKYKIAFKFFMSYAWMTFVCCELFSKVINDDDEYIFDLETANLLPKYPFSYEDINQNPYSCFLIDNNSLNIEENMLSIDCNKNYELYNGLTTPAEFARRLNIFCNGENEEQFLKYMDWSCCAITGSSIYACMMNGYQLMEYENDRDVNINYTDEELKKYFIEKNKKSDIDVICNKDSVNDFSIVVSELYENIKKIYESVQITKIASTVLFITQEFMNNEFTKLKAYLIDNDKKTKNGGDYKNYAINEMKIYDTNVIEYFYQKYYPDFKIKLINEYTEALKNAYPDEIMFNYLLNAEPCLVNFETCVLSNFKLKMFKYEVTIENTKIRDGQHLYYNKTGDKILAKITESLRYKIETEKSRTIEIFKSRNKNFMSTISKFHFSMVRGYWNGKTMRSVPTLVTSSMINLSHDYNYFSSTTHPSIIVNKYRTNGPCGILCSLSNRRDIALFMFSNPELFANFNISSEDEHVSTKIKKIFGLFRKNIFGDGVKTFEENFNDIIIKDIGFMNKLKAIGNNGSVIPLNKNYIDIFYEEINKYHYAIKQHK
jgi:hypothetical protein